MLNDFIERRFDPITPTSIPEGMSQETAHRDAEEARQRVARDIAAIAERVIHPLPKLRQRRPRRILAPHRPALPDSLTMDDPGLTDLPPGDYVSVFKRAGMRLMADNMTSVGKGVAYGAFFCDPVRAFGRAGHPQPHRRAGPGHAACAKAPRRGTGQRPAADRIKPAAGTEVERGRGEVIVGLVLAVFSLMGAVQTVIWGMNVAYERKEERGFVKQRVAAILITLILTASLVAVFTVLVPRRTWQAGWASIAATPARCVALVDAPMADPAARPASGVRRHPVPRPRRRSSAISVHHPGSTVRGGALDRGARPCSASTPRILVLQQNLGIARRRDHHPNVALALQRRLFRSPPK